MAITINNLSTGDLNFTGLKLPKGASKTVDYVVDNAAFTTAVAKGLISISPAVAPLVDSTTGTVSGTLADVTATPTQALVNGNFATIAARLTAVEAELDARTKFRY